MSILRDRGENISFEINSSACRSVKDVHSYLSELNLYPVNYDLKVLTSQRVEILVETDVFVKHKEEIINLPLVVLDC